MQSFFLSKYSKKPRSPSPSNAIPYTFPGSLTRPLSNISLTNGIYVSYPILGKSSVPSISATPQERLIFAPFGISFTVEYVVPSLLNTFLEVHY